MRAEQAAVPLDILWLQPTTSANLDCCISCTQLKNKTIKRIKLCQSIIHKAKQEEPENEQVKFE